MGIFATEARIRRQWYTSVAPTSEPVTLEELKAYARIDTTAEDAVLETYLTAARAGAEQYLNRALMPQTIVLLADSWPEDGVLPLPRPPLISVTSIAEVDEDGTETVYDADDYQVVTGVEPGYCLLKLDSTPPPLGEPRLRHSIKAAYQAGYANAVAVPAMIRTGILALATAIYENRVVDATMPPPEVQLLLASYRIRPIGVSIGR